MATVPSASSQPLISTSSTQQPRPQAPGRWEGEGGRGRERERERERELPLLSSPPKAQDHITVDQAVPPPVYHPLLFPKTPPTSHTHHPRDRPSITRGSVIILEQQCLPSRTRLPKLLVEEAVVAHRPPMLIAKVRVRVRVCVCVCVRVRVRAHARVRVCVCVCVCV